MFLATLDTPNYRFAALGTTEQEARGIIGAAWTHHAEQYGALLSVDDIADEVNVQELRPGTANRDGSHLVTADTWSSASRQTFIDTGAYLPTSEQDDDDDPDGPGLDDDGSPEQWNTSPAEPVDYTATLDRSDLAALTAGRRVRAEVWSAEDPHGMPALSVVLSYDSEA